MVGALSGWEALKEWGYLGATATPPTRKRRGLLMRKGLTTRKGEMVTRNETMTRIWKEICLSSPAT
jgi:hypothetical protein